MSVAAIDSAIDVAYWFFERAEKDGLFLENDKLFHLIFAAQLNYAQKYNKELLVPSMFVVEENGFIEPNLKKMFSMGRPFMPPVKLDDKVIAFLEAIWQKYAKVTVSAMGIMVKNTTAYKDNYQVGIKNVIEVNKILDLFKAPISKTDDERKKMLISQNGPVMVSKWKPRKLLTTSKKGNK